MLKDKVIYGSSINAINIRLKNCHIYKRNKYMLKDIVIYVLSINVINIRLKTKSYTI